MGEQWREVGTEIGPEIAEIAEIGSDLTCDGPSLKTKSACVRCFRAENEPEGEARKSQTTSIMAAESGAIAFCSRKRAYGNGHSETGIRKRAFGNGHLETGIWKRALSYIVKQKLFQEDARKTHKTKENGDRKRENRSFLSKKNHDHLSAAHEVQERLPLRRPNLRQI